MSTTPASKVRRRTASTLAIHLCRGNNRSQWYAEGGYDPIAEKLFAQLNVDAFLLEYDSERAGTFEPLRFVPRDKIVVLGLVSSKLPELEPQDQLVRRIEEASRYVPLENLAAQPAVRVRLGDGRQPADRRRAVEQARARRRDRARRLARVVRALGAAPPAPRSLSDSRHPHTNLQTATASVVETADRYCPSHRLSCRRRRVPSLPQAGVNRSMRQRLLTVGCAALLAFLAVVGPTAVAQQQAIAPNPSLSPERALLNQYRVSCHNQAAKDAGQEAARKIALDQLDVDRVASNPEAWERVVRKMRAGTMPPAGSRRPDDAKLPPLHHAAGGRARSLSRFRIRPHRVCTASIAPNTPM